MSSGKKKCSRYGGFVLLVIALCSLCVAQKDVGVRPSPADTGMKNAAVSNGNTPSGGAEKQKKKENQKKKKNTHEADPPPSTQEKEFEKVLMGIYG